MKRVSSLVAAVALILGVFGAVGAYRWASAGPRVEQLVSADVSSETSRPAAEKPAKPVVKFKPCKKPAHREGKACVVDVVQDVVVPAPATPETRSASGHTRTRSHDDGDDDKTTQSNDDGDDDGDHEDDDDHEDHEDHESDD